MNDGNGDGGLLPVEVCAGCGTPSPDCSCTRGGGQRLAKLVKRWRSKRFLSFVRSLPCSVAGCASQEIEAAHFGPRGVGTKVHDFLAVPLCSRHHREHHDNGGAWQHYDAVRTWQLRTIAAALFAGVLER